MNVWKIQNFRAYFGMFLIFVALMGFAAWDGGFAACVRNNIIGFPILWLGLAVSTICKEYKKIERRRQELLFWMAQFVWYACAASVLLIIYLQLTHRWLWSVTG